MPLSTSEVAVISAVITLLANGFVGLFRYLTKSHSDDRQYKLKEIAQRQDRQDKTSDRLEEENTRLFGRVNFLDSKVQSLETALRVEIDAHIETQRRYDDCKSDNSEMKKMLQRLSRLPPGDGENGDAR